jgi:hypothetical protein
MAQTSWPFENIDTSETQFSQWARNIGEGVKPNTLNELEVYGDSSGMQVKAKTGQALVRGHYYNNSAEETLTVTAADPSNDRIDNVVIELDPSANTIVLKVVAGTPAGSPTAPTLTQTDAGIYQIKLAEVFVEAASSTVEAGDVTDFRVFFVDDPAPKTVDVLSKTANYTLVVGDRGNTLSLDGTFTVTAPSATFAAGDRIDFVNVGSGTVTFAGSGVTISSKDAALTLDTQYTAASLLFTSASAAVLIGAIA